VVTIGWPNERTELRIRRKKPADLFIYTVIRDKNNKLGRL
jgi:hypothetical protein